MAKLSLVITHHNEPIELGKNLFHSINTQMGIDWDNVDIIVCDNTGLHFSYSDILDDCLNIKNKITFLNNPLCEGPGLNKQQGIDYCKTEWLTFLEFDDMLYSVTALYNIFNYIEFYSDYDVLQFQHIRSTDIKYDEFVARNGYGGAWGTVQKKSFFVDNNIRNLNLKMDNDIYINKLGRCVKNKKVEFIEVPIYVWCIRENSTSTIKLSEDSDFEQNYKDKIESSLLIIQLVHNYCSQYPDSTEFDYETELWIELPYLYWKTQMYKETAQNNINKQLIEEKNQQIASLYLSIIDKQWILEHLFRSDEYMTIYDKTFKEWLIDIFNLKD